MGIKIKSINGIGSGAIVFLVAFLASFAAASIFAAPSPSDARTVTTVIDGSGYYVSISASDITIPLVTTPNGATAIGTDTIVTKTNSKTGYKLYLSMADADVNANRLYMDGDSSSGYFISPTTGTISNPIELANNTWGYTVESGATASSGFIAVPLRGAENLIQSTNSANEDGVELGITYGVRATMAMPAGVYGGSIVYTAFSEGNDAADGAFSIFPTSTTNTTGGDTLTIATDLYTSVPDLGEVAITLSRGETTYTCENVQRISSLQAVTLTCDLPATEKIGVYDVTVSLPKFGKEYSLRDGFIINQILNDKDGNPITITTMQEMTSDICQSIETPAAFLADGTTINADVPEMLLRDTRDDNWYRIRKLADGNCWMTENLRLEFDGETTYTSADTNLAAGATIKPAATQARTAEATEEEMNAWNFSTQPTSEQTNRWLSRSNRNKRELDLSVSRDNLSDENQYLGTLYNWYTATAGSGTYETDRKVTVAYSICPAGWKLPPEVSNGSYNYLIRIVYKVITNQGNQYTVEDGNPEAYKILHGEPFSLIWAGNIYDSGGKIAWAGTSGPIWTASTSDSQGDAAIDASRALYYSSQVIYTTGGDLRTRGFSVRCVAK